MGVYDIIPIINCILHINYFVCNLDLFIKFISKEVILKYLVNLLNKWIFSKKINKEEKVHTNLIKFI